MVLGVLGCEGGMAFYGWNRCLGVFRVRSGGLAAKVTLSPPAKGPNKGPTFGLFFFFFFLRLKASYGAENPADGSSQLLGSRRVQRPITHPSLRDFFSGP